MPNAMTTVGQGGTSFIQIPTWAMNPNPNAGLTFIEIDFILHAPDVGNGIGYILGHSASSTFSISVSTTNALRYVSGSIERILSAGNLFIYGQRCTLRTEYNDTGVGATAWTRMLLNGNPVGPDWVGATQSNSINQAGRYSKSRHSPITIYGLKFGSSNPAAIGYEASWGPEGASGSGVNWADDSATRNLTITNATGAADSWWFFYPGLSPGTLIKRFDGAAFVSKPIKRWDGSAFVDVALKRWNGTSFVDL
ncbi:MAG: hypothetical protein U5L02_06470 [Rheinheimera sp.]|nr:hypothetical protein [Rheinheimera sp.]